jgi:hypothetical protein
MEYPWHVFATQWMSRGILPLWNPFVLLGVPFQAGVHGYLYPGWWTGLLLPPGLDFKLGILLHLVFAGVGGAWFARGRVQHRAASFLAGTTFALSGFMIMQLFAGHRVLFATAAYLPWVAGCLDRAEAGDRRFLLAGCLLCGLMVLCGNYQVVFIGMGGLLGFGLLEALLGEPARGARAATRLWGCGRAALRWTVVISTGAGVAAVQILPMAATLVRSQRSEGGLSFATSFASHPTNLITYLLPDFFGNHLERQFVGGWPFWDALGYLGIVPLAVCVVGLGALPWRRWIPAAVVTLAALVIALGDRTPLFQLYLALVPGADLFRTPARFCLLVALFGSLLPALALGAWLDRRTSADVRRAGLRSLLLVLVGSVCLLVALGPSVGLTGWLLSFADPIRLAALEEAEWTAMLDGRLQGMRLVVLWLAGAICLAAATRERMRRPAILLLLALHLADLYQFGHRYLRLASIHWVDWPDAVTEALATLGPGERVVPPPELAWYNYGAMHGIASPGGYDTFLEERYARYLNRAYGRELGEYFSIEPLLAQGPLMRLLGPRFRLSTQPLLPSDGADAREEGLRLVGRLDSLYLYEDRLAEPRVVLAHESELVVDEVETYRRLESPDFDLRRRALLEQDLPPDFQPGRPPPGALEQASILRYEPNRVEISVRAAAPAILVLSDLFAPGWTARIGERELPVLPANRVMRAVPLPAGRHLVEMTYRPPGLLAGGAISIASLVGLALLALRSRRRPG